MKKLIITMGLAIVTAVTANATATLIITDSAGHTTGPLTSAGGTITFIGTIGNWTLNVTTGIANPPFGSRPVTQPLIDLNSINSFAGGAGGKLTIQFFADGYGPISGALFHKTGGTQTGFSSVDFKAQVNGGNVDDQTSTISPFSFNTELPVTAGTGTTLGILATIDSGGATGLASFDSEVKVPDAGMTLALLGSALTGLALFARSRKTA
jgi:hypothetical protein